LENLFEKLKLYNETDIYPYHMPGHKRRVCGNLPEELYHIDITEIDGFDNLHQPEEILLKLQQQAAHVYGAEESFYLINGSTCGILAAVSATVPEGGRILMVRNCHKAAYHIAYLRNLTISYLYPEMISQYDICDTITPDAVENALEKESDIAAVLIVSPTYEGRIADIKAIAEIVHAKKIPLIVDEAHGAHLGFAEGFAENSCRCGADLVIHSVHKTLPAMTQTALLHVNGSLVDRDRLRRFLRIYQSSSPSYVLMAGIDNAIRYVCQHGKEVFADFRRHYTAMCEKLSACKKISFLQDDWKHQDVGKLVISVKNTILSGKELYNILLEEYHLQLEMAAETYALAMFTVNDSVEAYSRMTEALLDLDARLDEKAGDALRKSDEDTSDIGNIIYKSFAVGETVELERQVIPLKEAWDADSRWIDLQEAQDKPVAEFVNLYPPGIPLLVPGEYITADMISRIRNAVYQKLNVQGIQIIEDADEALQIRVKVIK